MKIIDNSKRSVHVNVWAIIILITMFFLFIGTFLGGYGFLKYKNTAKNSSFAIGSELTFPRSEEVVTLKNIYTDKNKDVMILQLGGDEDSRLPYRGTDYRIFLNSKSLEQYEEVDILFGRMSTDGDLFLVIPKPTDEVYTVFILNTREIKDPERQTADILADGSVESYVDDEGEFNEEGYARSLTKELSSYTYYGEDSASKKKEQRSVQVGAENGDMISVRVTLDPAFKQREYQPTVINEELLKEDNTFDFETFFNRAFRGTALTELEDQYNELNRDIKTYEETAQEYRDRLVDNPEDEIAQKEYDEVRSEISEMETEVSDIINKMDEYKGYEYDEELFKHLNTKAYIVTK